ncbi:hypothetical protein EELLY_v1c01640 [Entomoplasma ellychniae]|uniref:ABC-2 type transporter transmembrane domain-containing protein n=2 Tax=Entomoplasmataceae TaxID=33925 RepID=A0A2S5RG39_9MOLU|nr:MULTISPECIES: ABC transporter permease [Entomoplasmataceae]PPE04484.1 hypothetical protein EELLY_v1c01640 [Entomoplasma ellychniae]PPE06257.1 hypothetical protein MCORR_v1c05620 [Mesoplasma corruscae]
MIAIIKLELIKFLKNPFSLFFSFLLPFILLIFEGTVFGVKLYYIGPGLIIMNAATLTISILTNSLFNDRITKITKQISITQLSILKYMFGKLIFNYILFLINFFIITFFSFLIFKIYWTLFIIISLLFITTIAFLTFFFISVIISSSLETYKNCSFTALICFYIILFLSGSVIPAELFPNWVKIIQILIPSGSAILIIVNLKEGIILSSTWYFYLIAIIQLIVFALWAFKKFKWQ